MSVDTKRTKVRRWVRKHIPTWLVLYDFEIFVALLCLLAGVPYLLGEVDPASLEAKLPKELVTVWGFILTIGPLAILIGIFKHYRAVRIEDRVFWCRIEAWGLSALAYSAYIYASAILLNLPTQGWIAAMLVYAFGAVCHVREIDLQLQVVETRAKMGLQ